MRGIDQASIRAARSHGAGPAETFCRIFFPQTLPGIEVGLILTFVSMAGSFVLPVVLGGQSSIMSGVVINNQLNQEGAWGAASATAGLSRWRWYREFATRSGLARCGRPLW